MPEKKAPAPGRKMVYEVSVGDKARSDFMSRMDLGIEGVTETMLVCTLTTTTRFSNKLIEAHKKALKESLSKYYYVGEIKFVK